MATDPQPTLFETLMGVLLKVWPGVAGSVVALRWLPVTSTWFDRFLAAISGSIASAVLAPAMIEFTGMSSSRLESGVSFTVGLFGMAVAGELIRALREDKLGSVFVEMVRRLLGVRRND